MRPIRVSKLIATRDAEERHVDLQFATLDEMNPSAVRVDLYRHGQQPIGDGCAQFSSQAGRVDAGDHPVFDVFDQRIMAVQQRAGSKRKVFEAHSCQCIDNLIDDLVAFTKSVMERDGHAILQAGSLDRLLQRAAHFSVQLRVGIREIGRVRVSAGKLLEPADLRVLF